MALASPSSGSSSEGIKVHGHWTIEIRDPDGTLVNRREFQNALGASGPLILNSLVSGTKVPGEWRILLSGTGGPCLVTSGGAATCGILESTDSQAGTGTNFFDDLTVDVPITGANAGKFVLSGSATAAVNGDIGLVSTLLKRCVAAVAPSACIGASGSASLFTTSGVSPAEPVQAGQQIQVTVVISFS